MTHKIAQLATKTMLETEWRNNVTVCVEDSVVPSLTTIAPHHPTPTLFHGLSNDPFTMQLALWALQEIDHANGDQAKAKLFLTR